MPTFGDLISGPGGVRSFLNDTNAAAYRYSDADLMGYANDALLEIAYRRPDLFSTIGDIVCVAGTNQRVTSAGAMRLMDIYNVRNGRVVNETAREELDRFDSNWRAATAGPAVHWVRDPKAPLTFFVYPPAPVGQILVGQWATAPAVYGTTDTVPIPYTSTIKDYVVFRAEARDDEHVTSQRAIAFFQTFERGLGVTVETKAVTDGNG